MEDCEVAQCVAAAVGHSGEGVQVETLGGKQGLLVCRVTLPGAGSYVFKVVRQSASRELELTACIGRACPEAVPEVVCYEEDRKRGLYWMVVRDLGPRRLADSPTVEGYVAGAELLARIQLALLNDAVRLSDLGVPDVSPQRWEEVALAVLQAVSDSSCPRIMAERSEVERIAWTVDELVRDTMGIPSALVHGDLHAGNIALTDERQDSAVPPQVCLLDWGSAYIGTAFLALEELLWPAARYLRSQSDRDRVRAAYLRAWSPLLGKVSLMEGPWLASRVLVRLELLHEALRPSGTGDPFAATTAARSLQDAWRCWRRAG